MRFNHDTLNLVFFARGGQGAKTAAEILAQAGLREGKYVKAFPEFGPERSGAPIKTYVRLSSTEIKTAEPIRSPDVAVVLDETVLESDTVCDSFDLNTESVAIVNSAKSPEEIRRKAPHFKGKIYTIDASGLSMKMIGKPTPNVAILGYLVKITEAVKLADVIAVFEMLFKEKIGEEATQKNILTIEKSYDTL